MISFWQKLALQWLEHSLQFALLHVQVFREIRYGIYNIEDASFFASLSFQVSFVLVILILVLEIYVDIF